MDISSHEYSLLEQCQQPSKVLIDWRQYSKVGMRILTSHLHRGMSGQYCQDYPTKKRQPLSLTRQKQKRISSNQSIIREKILVDRPSPRMQISQRLLWKKSIIWPFMTMWDTGLQNDEIFWNLQNTLDWIIRRVWQKMSLGEMSPILSSRSDWKNLEVICIACSILHGKKSVFDM